MRAPNHPIHHYYKTFHAKDKSDDNALPAVRGTTTLISLKDRHTVQEMHWREKSPASIGSFYDCSRLIT